jgi:hypothetical protein
MNAALTLMQPTVRLADSSLDTLAVAHYEQVYALAHAFYDDPSVCLSLANQAFRDATGNPELVTVCRNLISLLSRRPGLELPVPSHTLLSNAAWLMKEIVSLRYAEIGEVLRMDVEQVKHEIAAVRETLLTLTADSAAA